MDYYKLSVTDENKVWKKYAIFDSFFLYNGKEFSFPEVYKQESKLKNLKIQALNPGGVIVKNGEELVKKDLPNFCNISRAIILREDLFIEKLFSEIRGIDFYTIKINGQFKYNYKLIYFSNDIECVDFSKSVYKKYVYEMPTLLKSKIRSDIDGFFLSGWNSGQDYDKYNLYPIVNENIKNRLMQIEKSSEFLIFTKMTLSE
jgi:hypothetical protein